MYNANHKRHLLISSRYCTLTSLDVLRTRPEDSLLTDLVVRSPGMVPITPNFRQLGGKRIVLFKHIHGRLAWELCAADVLKAARQLWWCRPVWQACSCVNSPCSCLRCTALSNTSYTWRNANVWCFRCRCWSSWLGSSCGAWIFELRGTGPPEAIALTLFMTRPWSGDETQESKYPAELTPRQRQELLQRRITCLDELRKLFFSSGILPRWPESCTSALSVMQKKLLENTRYEAIARSDINILIVIYQQDDRRKIILLRVA
ncbi:hypothetical protein T310_4015 [Rasamsonia emersonii CBS 393.64]|uniref:Uncharacterized protein n=1 Tax=Rasamsonia emersonii (strain ATCC 16479 / CBS 393.64 / IMI 116815) TaxID=1408163 RepID=A0A0F4YWE4_RASE3|nr:hypothetical protein T310_4015 [Rasamsonia emersonii CBS 393.64]KKA21953.1 hypothetical protein T310_4015 [Rasamsonia emersonii CBS 393.64]